MCRMCGSYSDLVMSSIAHALASTLCPNDFLLISKCNFPVAQRITRIIQTPISCSKESRIQIWYQKRVTEESITAASNDLIMVPKRTPVIGAKGSQTFKTRADTLHEGDWMVIRDRACKITSIGLSGCFCKGGHFHFVAMDGLEVKKMEVVASAADMMTVPIVEEEELLLVGYDEEEGRLSVIEADGRAIREGLLAGSAEVKKACMMWEAGTVEGDVFVVVRSVLGEVFAVGARIEEPSFEESK